MNTDSLFYELFQLDPRSLFDLVQLQLEGQYAFHSISIKTTEKRLDGFFQRTDGEGPNVFVEVQGYHDPLIYWRLLREIATYYEQTGSDRPFIAIVLFLAPKDQPDAPCPLWPQAPHRWLTCTLEESLQTLGDQAGVLTVLKPLRLSQKKQLPKLIPQWRTELQALKLPKRQLQTLLELLEYAILRRFPKLTLKEVENMIRLSPLEQSVAVQELVQRGVEKATLQGRAEGRQEGMVKGKLIGKIHATQRFLRRPQTAEKKLLAYSLKELRALLKQLEAELA